MDRNFVTELSIAYDALRNSWLNFFSKKRGALHFLDNGSGFRTVT